MCTPLRARVQREVDTRVWIMRRFRIDWQQISCDKCWQAAAINFNQPPRLSSPDSTNWLLVIRRSLRISRDTYRQDHLGWNQVWIWSSTPPCYKDHLLLEDHHQLVTIFKAISRPTDSIDGGDYNPTCGGWLLLSILTPNQDCVGLPPLTKGGQVDSARSNHRRHMEGGSTHR